MDFIKSYNLVETQDSCDLIIYFDKGTMDVEFADDFGILDNNDNSFNQNIIQQISEKFPNKKIDSVKIMVGTLLLSSFMMASPTSEQASESTS